MGGPGPGPGVMGAVTFRRATAADLPAIVAMLADDGLGRGREDASLPLARGYVDGFAAIEADPNQMLAVAGSDGVVVGTLQLTFLPGLSHKGAWRGQVESVRVEGDIAHVVAPGASPCAAGALANPLPGPAALSTTAQES